MPKGPTAPSTLLAGFNDEPNDTGGTAVAVIEEEEEEHHTGLQDDRSRTAEGPPGAVRTTPAKRNAGGEQNTSRLPMGTVTHTQISARKPTKPVFWDDAESGGRSGVETQGARAREIRRKSKCKMKKLNRTIGNA